MRMSCISLLFIRSSLISTEAFTQRVPYTSIRDYRDLRSTVPLFAVGSSDNQLESALDDESEAEAAPLEEIVDNEVDVAIFGAALGGLCAGAILNTLYGKKVAVFESHYLSGGCAHAFDRKASNGMTFTFDSGPTILLG